MNEIDKIEAIMRRADVPTSKEVVDIFGVLLQTVLQLKEQVYELIDKNNEEATSKHKELYVEMEDMEEKIKEKHKDMESVYQKSMKEIKEEIETTNGEIEVIKDMFDPIVGRINEVEKKEMPTIPEDLINEKRLFDEIEVLEKRLTEKINQLPTKVTGGASRRVFIPYRDDLSSACDGVTKSFYLSRAPLKTGSIMVYGTDFPVILRPDVDFVITNKTVTLTSQVPAPSSGATLIVTYFA